MICANTLNCYTNRVLVEALQNLLEEKKAIVILLKDKQVGDKKYAIGKHDGLIHIIDITGKDYKPGELIDLIHKDKLN